MIEVQHLAKYYGSRKAIDDLSFSVGKGEILGFLGPNGAGKTTTMKILTGFMPASAGVARIAGFDVLEDPIEVKQRIGYLPETPPVYKEMVVSEYLAYKAALHGIQGTTAKKAVEGALEKCNLTHVRHRLIGNLSKGYRQRVGLAQAIVHNPAVLILDEPTVGLDPKQIIEIRELIRSFAGEHTVILSTHILPEVEATCSRVLIINEGRIVESGQLEAISTKLRKGNIFIALVKENVEAAVSQLKGLNGVASVQVEQTSANSESKLSIGVNDSSADLRNLITQTLFQARTQLLEFKRESLSLEEIFLKLTTEEKHD